MVFQVISQVGVDIKAVLECMLEKKTDPCFITTFCFALYTLIKTLSAKHFIRLIFCTNDLTNQL